MWLEIAAGAFLLGQYIYHRWIEDKPIPKQKEIPYPRVEEGGVIPLIYGRCRVRSPFLSYSGPPGAVAGGVIPGEVFEYLYYMNMLFVIGISHCDAFGNSTSSILKIWVGERRLNDGLLRFLDGTGGFETPAIVDNYGSGSADVGFIGGEVEFLNGNPDQQVVIGISANTYVSVDIALDWAPEYIPGLRGRLSAYLFNDWFIGSSTNPGTYNFEVASYPEYSRIGLFSPTIGSDEANPAEVIYDLFCGKFGKLGLPDSFLDFTSFNVAGNTLIEENHGISISIEEARTAAEIISIVCEQIDAIIGENEEGKIYIKLIRPDYNPSTIPEITPNNCRELSNLAAGGWENIATRVRLVYEDRTSEYREQSVYAENQAVASIDNQPVEVVLKMPGIKNKALAEKVCARELAARSRPIAKCTAIVDRQFIHVNDGDPIAVTWPDLGWNKLIFRVVKNDRCLLEDNMMKLDLIQDFYFPNSLGVEEDVLPSFPASIYSL